MEPEDVPPVTDGRALTTDRDRHHLARAGDVNDSEYYQAVSRVRRRIRENMAEDIELLSEHHPDLHGELQEVVCARTVTDDPIEAAIEHVTDALADLHRAHSRRSVQRETDARGRSHGRQGGDVALPDSRNATEHASLETALERIDAARRLIVDEVERSSSHTERNGDET